MNLLRNRYRDGVASIAVVPDCPFPSVEVHNPRTLLDNCPVDKPTALTLSEDIADLASVGRVWIKDERTRMGLGSFKALGAAYVIASDAANSAATNTADALSGVTYVTASAGNHGMSVAAGAGVFGARAMIFIAETVPESFARRLGDKGAEVVRAGHNYEASMDAAKKVAEREGWRLLSDSSWAGYFDAPYRLMEGYLVLLDEVFEQIDDVPTHIFLQAGVGGLAGAIAALARARWHDVPTIVVVEPDAAPALFDSVRAGKPVAVSGPVSSMGRLDCKEPSLIALKGLARDADFFATITDEEAAAAMPALDKAGFATTPSGGAGLAALLASEPHRATLGLDSESRVLTILSEGPEE